MARVLVEKYIFTPGAAGVGTVKFPGKCDATQLLIVSNKTTQENIYALGDVTRNGTVVYNPADNTDPTRTFTCPKCTCRLRD